MVISTVGAREKFDRSATGQVPGQLFMFEKETLQRCVALFRGYAFLTP